jgi:hypothetical protein
VGRRFIAIQKPAMPWLVLSKIVQVILAEFGKRVQEKRGEKRAVPPIFVRAHTMELLTGLEINRNESLQTIHLNEFSFSS